MRGYRAAAVPVLMLAVAEVVVLMLVGTPSAPLLWMTVGMHAVAAVHIGFIGAGAGLAGVGDASARRGAAPPARRNVRIMSVLATLYVVLGWFTYAVGSTLSSEPLPAVLTVLVIVAPVLLIGYGAATFVLVSRATRGQRPI